MDKTEITNNNPNLTNQMMSSIEIENINNNKIKKILSKNEIEDIEKCLISMSEEGTGRHEISSVISDKKNEIHNNNLLEKVKFNKLNIAKENFIFNNSNKEMSLENNPNLIFSNNKNFKFNNLKSKNEIKNNRPNSRNSSKSNTNKFKNNNVNTNLINTGKLKVVRNKSNSGKFNNDNYINIDNQNSEYDSNNSKLNINSQAVLDILAALPSKIFIDSDQYNKLKYKPQTEVKIDELICMRVFEKIESLTSQLSELRRNYNSIRETKLNLEEENALLKLEKEKISKTKEYQLEALNETATKAELELKKNQELIKTQIKKIEEFTPKVLKYDELNEKYLKLIKENQNLTENQKTISDLITSLKKEKDEILSKLDIIKIESEALKNDKFFLARENSSLSDKNRDLSDKIKSLEDEIKQTKRLNNDYIEKLTNKNCNIDSAYEEKLKSELIDMKRKYTEDMENLKKLYDEISQKRCIYLQDERDDYKQKNIKLEKIIKDKEESLDFLNNEVRSLNKKTDEEIGYLKIQLKIKSEELDRVTNIYEENSNLMKILKAENESFKDKIDILRTELISKEAAFKEEISEYKSQVNSMKEKILNYEHIENELDKVIVESAYNSEKDPELLGIIKDIPTTSKRRISQCLVLANKLKLAAVENEKLKDMIKKLEKDLSASNEEKELYKAVSEKAKQPYAYIIKNLQDSELELFRKNNEIAEKEKSIKSLLRENDLLSEKISAMEVDLKAILANRQKLDYLEEMVVKFIGSNDEKGLIENINNYMYNNYSMKNKDFNLISSNNNMMSTNNTNYNSVNFKQPNNLNYSINPNYSYSQPERDINSQQYQTKVPLWYQNLKSKKQI